MAEQKDGCVKPARGPIAAPASAAEPQAASVKEGAMVQARVGKEAIDFEANAYLEALPLGRGGKAVTFSTFGDVCSGGLHAQAARILRRKGYAVVGAIKVPAEHSLMLKSANPLGKGHPSREDLECVRGFTRSLVDAMQNDTLKDIGSPWFAPAHARAIAMMMSVLPHLSVADKASVPLLPIMKKMIGEASVVDCLS